MTPSPAVEKGSRRRLFGARSPTSSAPQKHFPREIAVGAAELHARMGSFMVANIFGMTPPAGTQPIKNESSRAMLSIFFAKTRMGWKETVVSEHANADGKPFIFEVSKTDAKL